MKALKKSLSNVSGAFDLSVSDSNLKVRSKLKEKVAQRSSPLLRRKDLAGAKRKTPLSSE